MNAKTTIPITEARRRIFDIAKEIQGGVYYTFTEKGHPKAVMMSAEEFESWQETLDVITDIPDLDENIADLKKDLKSRSYKKYRELEDFLNKEGWVAGKSKLRKHALSSSAKTRGGKRTKARSH